MTETHKNTSLQQVISNINLIAQGRPIILHTNAGVIAQQLGCNTSSKKDVLKVIINNLRQMCSSSSIFIPTFDYEYCSSRLYDPSDGKTQLGGLSRFCAKNYIKDRTLVPIFNHVDLKQNHRPSNSFYRLDKGFGKNSFYDWFTEEDGFIFFWGCSITNSNTYIHHIETLLQVTYRFKKTFEGIIQVDGLPIHTCFEFNVRPLGLAISYQDQGRKSLDHAGLLIKNEEHKLEGYSTRSFLKIIIPSLERDEFCLLTDNTRINISQYFSNPDSLREFSEELRSVLIISDSTLDFVTRGWESHKYCIESIYASSLFLKLDDLCNNKDFHYSVLIVMPSLDTFSLGPLDPVPNYSNVVFQTAKSYLDLLIKKIKSFQDLHPRVKIIYLSPLNSSIVYQLAGSQDSAVDLYEVFSKLDRFAFVECNAIGVWFDNMLNNTYGNYQIVFSWLNYLRYRFPFEINSIDNIRKLLIKILNKQFVKFKAIKAISVDLDNTLWCGIAGDGEVEISKDFPASASFLLQRALKQLRDRGVFLTITSKNDRETLDRVFTMSKDKMLLTLEDFSCIEANWGRKSSSLVKQANALNINTDSFLHIDDSDLELNEIMASLPLVEVVKFSPENINEIINHLLRHPRLSKVNITNSDRVRVNQVPILVETLEPFAGETSEERSYLQMLNIAVNVVCKSDKPFDASRASQLLSKTNQFNTSQQEYEYFSNSIDFDIFCLLYSDNNGIEECCSVMCVRNEELTGRLVICSFVLSCRFFSRGLEYYFLEKVLEICQSSSLFINFTRTKKNTPTLNFLKDIASNEILQNLSEMKYMEFVDVPIDLDKLKNRSACFKKHFKSFQP